MIKRKKTIIDGMDREILRFLVNTKIPPTSRQIAQRINLSGAAILPRLDNLKSQGIIRKVNCGAIRKKINAPSRICWDLDLIKKRKR